MRREVRTIAVHWTKHSTLCCADRLAVCDERISSIAPGSVDIVVFPESFLHSGLKFDHVKELKGEYHAAVAHAERWALQLRSYIVLPVIREDQGTYTNSVVVLSRTGAIVGHYQKRYPWPSNLRAFELEKGVTPGRGDGCVVADVGCFGVQTCFDVNWPRNWNDLEQRGVTLVLYPSEYAGGFALQARAWQVRAPIVAAILGKGCRVVDMTGRDITHSLCRSDNHMSFVTLNTNRVLVHEDHNWRGLRELAKLDSIKLTRLRHDNVFLAEAPATGRDIREVLEECGVRELGAYLREALDVITRSRAEVLLEPDAAQ